MYAQGRLRFTHAHVCVYIAVGILFECLQTGGFGIRKAPRPTLSLAFITLSLGLYSFDLGVNETGPETGPSVRPSVRPPVRPSARPSGRPTVRPSVRPSVRSSVRPSVRPTVRPPVGGPWVVRGWPVGGPREPVGVRGDPWGPWVARGRPVGGSWGFLNKELC